MPAVIPAFDVTPSIQAPIPAPTSSSTPAAPGTRTIPCPATMRAGGVLTSCRSTIRSCCAPSWRRRRARPEAQCHRAEGRRLLLRLHGREGGRDTRCLRAGAHDEAHQRHQQQQGPDRGNLQPAPPGHQRAVRFLRHPGLPRLQHDDRQRRPGRAGHARPRLLPEGRSQIGGDPQPVRGARAEDAGTRGREAGDGGRGRQGRHEDRDRAGQGVHGPHACGATRAAAITR